MDLHKRFEGVILGTAVGDAIGLPREGLSRRRAERMFGGAPLRHRLFFGRGMISDDTEHTCMTAQALLASSGNPQGFARSLGWRLRWWLLAFPAGVGMATARACLKLWIGFPPGYSGVWSAGNGPAMRAAIIGAYSCADLDALHRLVAASSRLTHTDPAAEHGARAVALAAAYAMRKSPDEIQPGEYAGLVRIHLAGTPMAALIEKVIEAVDSGTSFVEYLDAAGLERGIGGYINHTVPAALFCWLRWPGDFRRGVEEVVLAGGDTDSTGAIVGALIGASSGSDAIPREWIDGLMEWPRSVSWMRNLANRLAARCSSPTEVSKPIALFWPGVVLRNVFFLLVVLAHALRRLWPF